LVAVLADQDQADDQRHRGRRPAELACAERRNRTRSITRHGWLAGRWRRVLRQLGLPRLLTGVCLLPLSLPATRLLLPPLRVGHLPLLLDAGYPRRKLPCSKSSSSENHRLPEAGSGFGSAGGGSAGAASGCGVTATGFGGGVGAGCGSSAGASYSSSSIWPIRAAASGRSGRLAHGFSGFFSSSEASSSFAFSASASRAAAHSSISFARRADSSLIASAFWRASSSIRSASARYSARTCAISSSARDRGTLLSRNTTVYPSSSSRLPLIRATPNGPSPTSGSNRSVAETR